MSSAAPIISVPLANLFGYAIDLRSLTGRRGVHFMHFLKYQQIPEKVMEKELDSIRGY